MKFCIIGSGISGLSSAYYLLEHNPNSEIVIYEKNRIGGHAYTYQLNDKENRSRFSKFLIKLLIQI